MHISNEVFSIFNSNRAITHTLLHRHVVECSVPNYQLPDGFTSNGAYPALIKGKFSLQNHKCKINFLFAQNFEERSLLPPNSETRNSPDEFGLPPRPLPLEAVRLLGHRRVGRRKTGKSQNRRK